MTLTDDEQLIWADMQAFFCPNGDISEAAFDAYLGRYVDIPYGHAKSVKTFEHSIIGLVLKKASDAAFEKAFKRYYCLSKRTPAFDLWMSAIASERTELLIKVFNAATPQLDIDQQVMVALDAKKWLPESTLEEEVVQLLMNTKGTPLIWEALAYSVGVLEHSSFDSKSTKHALNILENALVFAQTHPEHPELTWTVKTIFCSLYLRVNHSLQKRIEDCMFDCIFGGPKMRTHLKVTDELDALQQHSGLLFHALMRRYLKIIPMENHVFFFHHWTLDTQDVRGKKYFPGTLLESTKRALFELLPVSMVDEYLSGALNAFFSSEKTLSKSTLQLKNAMYFFFNCVWDNDKKTSFRTSSQFKTCILLFLYMAASGHHKYGSLPYAHGIPVVQWEPLPLLKNMYPEYRSLWNEVTIVLLNMPWENTQEKRQPQYEHVMASMFNTCSNVFFSDAPSFEMTRQLIENTGVNPLNYFMNTLEKPIASMTLHLPANMVDFS